MVWPELSQIGAMIAAVLGSAGLWKILARALHGVNAVEKAVYAPALAEVAALKLELADQRRHAASEIAAIRAELDAEHRRCDGLQVDLTIVRDRLTRAETEVAALKRRRPQQPEE